jgi:2-polyprenyl-6-methoxyphenol hydroxylase-like FAD-dependent oxidoreductase
VLVSTGPGWVLAGDAGLVMDPGTGQGMGHAMQDAEALAAAIGPYLGGGDRTRLARYQKERDQRRLPMYKFTLDLAGYTPRPGTDELFEAIAASPEQTQAFFGVLTGTRSPDTFFALGNLRRLMGWRGLLSMARSR